MDDPTEEAFAAGVADEQAEPPLTRADAAAIIRRMGPAVVNALRATLQDRDEEEKPS